VRVAIISDIHSNLAALEAVLADAGAVDAVWCLGDVVGYGPYPNECVDLLRAREAVCIAGNHDLAALGRVNVEDFHPDAAKAAIWNGEQLTADNRQWLEARPEVQVLEAQGSTLVHGSPRDPIWEYILDVETALDNLRYFNTALCLVGHSHVPTIFALHAGEKVEFAAAQHGQTVQLRPGSRYIFNPGSVGQPRDGDPRAAYAIWDTEAATMRFERVEYDIAVTQRQMREARLPSMLVERLSYGR
jgi:diadenosine tetraphosphatase ApaH/serine/threonine PP2A family protein phosphatase